MALKQNYKDDILDVSVNTKRKYRMTENQDGTVSLDDETVYTQEGDSFGATDMNATNGKVNALEGDIDDINDNLTNKQNKDWVEIANTTSSSETTVSFNESDYSELLLVSFRDDGSLASGGCLFPISLYKTGATLYGTDADRSFGVITRVSATQLKLYHTAESTYFNKLIVYAR